METRIHDPLPAEVENDFTEFFLEKGGEKKKFKTFTWTYNDVFFRALKGKEPQILGQFDRA